MKPRILLVTALLVASGGMGWAQESAQAQGSFRDLWKDHKEYLRQQKEENRAWWKEHQQQKKAAIEKCKADGLAPKECGSQVLSGLRQEAIDHVKARIAEREEYHKNMQGTFLQKLEERQKQAGEFYPEYAQMNPPGTVGGPGAGPQFKGGNPPGPIGGPGMGPRFKDRFEDARDYREDVFDRREDVRDRREDVRDFREDVYDRRENAWDAAHNPPPGTEAYRRDRLEDIRDYREDVYDRREDVRDRREDVFDRREDVRDRREDVRGRGALPDKRPLGRPAFGKNPPGPVGGPGAGPRFKKGNFPGPRGKGNYDGAAGPYPAGR